MEQSFSSASAERNKTPFLAALPTPTVIAVGVARPSAQGQEITNTEIAERSACSTFCVAMSQTASVSAEIAITTGTKIALTLSATRAMGALEDAASSSRRMMREREESSPVRSARTVRAPESNIQAVRTSVPSCFSTGILSPVRADSSTVPLPESTTPSAGIRSPARMRKISSFCNSSIGMSVSFSSLTTVTKAGASVESERMASAVLFLALSSRSLPTDTSVRIIAADSK